MARDVATIDAELDSLRAIRATGAGRITVGGRTIEYRTLAEIDRALQALQTERVTVSGATRGKRAVRVVTARGL